MSVSVSDSPTQNLTPSTRQAQAALETVQREIAACALCVEAGFIPDHCQFFTDMPGSG